MADKRKCPSCGNEAMGGKFCPECGAELINEQTARPNEEWMDELADNLCKRIADIIKGGPIETRDEGKEKTGKATEGKGFFRK